MKEAFTVYGLDNLVPNRVCNIMRRDMNVPTEQRQVLLTPYVVCRLDEPTKKKALKAPFSLGLFLSTVQICIGIIVVFVGSFSFDK